MAVIRGYEARDLQACRRLWVELTQQHRDIFDSSEIGGEDPGRAFDEHLARVGVENIWVAEGDEEILGLAGMIPDIPELEPVVVSEAYRRLGIGRLLAETVISAARERGDRTIQVRPVARNVEAIRFFHALGFDVLHQLELGMDLADREQDPWVPGERLADRDFRY